MNQEQYEALVQRIYDMEQCVKKLSTDGYLDELFNKLMAKFNEWSEIAQKETWERYTSEESELSHS